MLTDSLSSVTGRLNLSLDLSLPVTTPADKMNSTIYILIAVPIEQTAFQELSEGFRRAGAAVR